MGKETLGKCAANRRIGVAIQTVRLHEGGSGVCGEVWLSVDILDDQKDRLGWNPASSSELALRGRDDEILGRGKNRSDRPGPDRSNDNRFQPGAAVVWIHAKRRCPHRTVVWRAPELKIRPPRAPACAFPSRYKRNVSPTSSGARPQRRNQGDRRMDRREFDLGAFGAYFASQVGVACSSDIVCNAGISRGR